MVYCTTSTLRPVDFQPSHPHRSSQGVGVDAPDLLELVREPQQFLRLVFEPSGQGGAAYPEAVSRHRNADEALPRDLRRGVGS